MKSQNELSIFANTKDIAYNLSQSTYPEEFIPYLNEMLVLNSLPTKQNIDSIVKQNYEMFNLLLRIKHSGIEISEDFKRELNLLIFKIDSATL